MTTHRRTGARALSLTTILLLASACGSANATDSNASEAAAPDSSAAGKDRTPRPGGQLTVGLTTETNSLNPYIGQWSVSSYSAANAMLEPLAAVDVQGVAHAYLAETIEPTGDFKQWTIKLRPGVVFHNGEKLDAAAVKKNLETGKKSGLTAQIFTTVDRIETVAESTVVVHMSQPWATFPATLALQAGYMVAPAMIDDPAAANADPIGTGPFKFASRVRDSSLTTKKNPNYWRKDTAGKQLPYLDAVEFKILPDTASRSSALRSGSIDAMDVLTPNELSSQLESARKGEVQAVTGAKQETDETVLALNTSKEPFNDPKARRALAVGLDQERLASAAFQNSFPAAWGMFEEGSPYYIPRSEAGYPNHDVNAAKELVRQYEQEHGKPLEFTVLVPPDPEYLAVAQQVQADAKELGIKIEIQAIEQSTMVTRVIATGDYQAAGFLLWSSPTPDQGYVMIASKANPAGLSLNFTRHDDPEITAAMDAFRTVATPQQRIDAMKTVQRRLAADQQMIFLVHSRAAWVYANGVQGVKDATTFPGTDATAYGRHPTTPFFAAIWKDAAG